MDSDNSEAMECEHLSQGYNSCGRPHPLFLPSVVNEVASYLAVPDLMTFRLVCRLWDEEGFKFLRRKSQVHFKTERQLEDFVLSMEEHRDFCPSYQFGSDMVLRLRTYPETCDPAVEKFFTLFGPHIKSLFFNNSKWYGGDLKYILFEKATNLEELSLVAEVIGRLFPDGDNQGQLIPNIKCLRLNLRWTRIIRNTEMMADILSILPNVQVISWMKTPGDDIKYDRNFQRDLERAFSAEPLPNGSTIRDTVYDLAIHSKELPELKLTRIECNMRLNNESVVSLDTKRFPLTHLDLTLTTDVKACRLQSLFNTLSSSLTHLKLEFHPSDRANCPGELEFPCMKSLRHLFLHRFKGSILITENFPNLLSFTIQESDFIQLLETDGVMQLHDKSKPHHVLKTLQTFADLSKSSLSENHIEYLAKMFPSIKRLGLETYEHENQDQFYRYFKYLEVFGPPLDKGIGELSLPKTEKEWPEYSKCKLKRLKLMF